MVIPAWNDDFKSDHGAQTAAPRSCNGQEARYRIETKEGPERCGRRPLGGTPMDESSDPPQLQDFRPTTLPHVEFTSDAEDIHEGQREARVNSIEQARYHCSKQRNSMGAARQAEPSALVGNSGHFVTVGTSHDPKCC